MRQLFHQRRILNLKLSCSSLSVILLSAPGRLQPRAGCSLGVVRVACLGGRIRGYDVGYRVKCTTWRIKCRFPDASRRWRSATCFPGVEHRQSRYLNNRAENSHRPTRRRERQMQPFKSPEQAQGFLFAHAFIHGHIHPRRHLMAASAYRAVRSTAFNVCSRRRALSIRRDQQCNRPPGPTSPLEVNVTMPQKLMPWTPK